MRRIFRQILFSILSATILSCGTNTEHFNNSATVFVEKTEAGYRLIRNGEIFHIKGAGGNAHLEELKNAGGNTLRCYKPDLLPKLLEEAEKLDLAIIADIPIPKSTDDNFYSNPEEFKKLRTEVAEIVNSYKDHPALLYWNLGNEIIYPSITGTTAFISKYNELLDLVHDLDPNHPVSTAIIGGNRRRLISIAINSPKLDFLSFNSFGNLNDLKERLSSVKIIWNGPYVISEWGINGPWEEETTAWKAPIEPTSTKKAEQIRERYEKYILPLDSHQCLGNIAFFWGNKHERTDSWYSIFSEKGEKSQHYFELKKFWLKDTSSYKGPKLKYALINKKGSGENITLLPNSENKAELLFQDGTQTSKNFKWEIREEAWVKSEKKPCVIASFSSENKKLIFKAPEKEGPYRLFVYTVDSLNNFATTNIPFYVLNTKND